MFENTSSKIKITAKIFFILFSLASIVAGIILIVNYFDLPKEYKDDHIGLLLGGLALIFLGPFLFWTLAISLYGEAVIIDNTNGTHLESDKFESETNLKIAKIKRLKKYLIQNVITEEEYNNEVNKLKDL